MKKALTITLSIVVIASVLAGTLRWNAQRRDAIVIETHLLPAPSAKLLNPELAQRIGELNKRAIEGPERIESLAMLSRVYHANGYLNHAWQTYRILIEIDEKNPKWLHRLATIVSGFGQLSDAVTLYRKAIELDQEYIPTRIHLGDTLLKLNRYDEAKTVYQSILDSESTNPYALFGQARVSLAQNDTTRAKRFLEIARHSNNRIGGDLLADIYERLGETSKARALLHEVTWSSHVSISDPRIDDIVSDCYDSFEVAMAAGKAGRAGDLVKAVRLMNKSITLDPLDHYSHDHLAKLYLLQGNIDQAKESYANCTNVLPTYDQGWAGLISIEIKAGDHVKASELIEQALVHCPNSLVINNYKGDALTNENRPQEAIPFFETTIRNFPQNAVGYNYLARTYIRIGQNGKALEQLQKALNAEPSNPLTLELITIFFILNRDHVKAENYLQRAVLSPRISEDIIRNLQTMFNEEFE